jgi:hypothetical protein
MLPQLLDPRPYLVDLPDPRRETQNKLHKLHDILMIVRRCCINRDRPHIQGHEQAKAEVSDTELAGVQRGVGGTWIVDGVV